MRAKKYLSDLRLLSKSDLSKRLQELREEYFNQCCKKSIGQITDTSILKKTRKNIAQVKTLIKTT